MSERQICRVCDRPRVTRGRAATSSDCLAIADARCRTPLVYWRTRALTAEAALKRLSRDQRRAA